MNKYARCLWIVNALNDYGKASLKELNDRWVNSSINDEGEEILPRTFARDKEFIADTFQLDIEYDGKSRKYELVNADEIKGAPLFKYLLANFHVSHLSAVTLRLKDKVMVEEANTGVERLSVVMDAIERGCTLHFRYTSYYKKDRETEYEVIPCFVRLFEHRWYVVCEFLDHSQSRVLALERMHGLTTGPRKLSPSPWMNPKEFYRDCFGIIRDDQSPTDIRIKVYGPQADYVRSLPIHSSQQEIASGNGYAVFRLYLRPSFDLIQHLLWHKKIEVLSPAWLRKQMKEELEEMLGRYTKENNNL